MASLDFPDPRAIVAVPATCIATLRPVILPSSGSSAPLSAMMNAGTNTSAAAPTVPTTSNARSAA
ncbi:MAG: hypothetical protein IPG84_18890 [Betaproteobacteria bacterium]|nr:hypothetical protein [Betaproteobacteria bacterium]